MPIQIQVYSKLGHKILRALHEKLCSNGRNIYWVRATDIGDDGSFECDMAVLNVGLKWLKTYYAEHLRKYMFSYKMTGVKIADRPKCETSHHIRRIEEPIEDVVLFCLYEALKSDNIDKVRKKYGEAVFMKAVGTPSNPFVTSKRGLLKQELVRMNEEYNQKLNKASDDRRKALDEATKAINDKYTKETNDLADEYVPKIRELEDKINSYGTDGTV